MTEIEVVLFEKNILWYEIYSAECPDTEIDLETMEDQDSENPMMKLGSMYDYAILEDNSREFYTDIIVKLPHTAAMMMRSQYSIKADGFEWEYLFYPERLKPIVYDALMNSMIEFRAFCADKGVKLPAEMLAQEPELTDEMVDGVCYNFVEDYNSYRKIYDAANADAQKEIELNCPRSNGAIVTLNLTFLVMEQILFYNRRFNRAHNREAFFNVVPEMKFNTLRMKCIQIGQHPVALTVEDIHYFLICMDCALQMILGDKADYLTPVLQQRGVTEEVQQMWFKNASQLLNACRKSVEDSTRKGEKFDWSGMIR
ncbi:hypothetical protein [Parabacteroides sp. FAFU027]|uniref:hypothetical protein n=1 Tax=Parabacteroides sp. FAFU027 TaxID=2922715 RepID=UPI001FAFD3B6|nr:hypothetical protein [Parabacteroides sp. FAFU027]